MRGILFLFLLVTLLAFVAQSALSTNRIEGDVDYSVSCDQEMGDYVNVMSGILYDEDCGISDKYYWATSYFPPEGTYMCSAHGGDQQPDCCKVGNYKMTYHDGEGETWVDGLQLGCDWTPDR